MNYETPVEEDARGIINRAHGVVPEWARRKAVLVTVIILLAIGLVAWFARSGSGVDEDGATSQLPVVTVVHPVARTIVGEIEATGTLAARREMPVGSVGEGGRVVSVPVEPGQWVKQGQVLAVIDRSVQSQQIAGQAAQVDAAKADAALAQANLDRGLQLVERGFISKANIDQLRATRDAAVARVRTARAMLGELQARTARLDIRAPAAGLLLTRDVEPGQVVGGGSAVLFSIARDGELELLAKVGEEDLARLSVGEIAQVRPVGADKTYTGQIWQLSPVIDQQSRQGTARIALAYAPGLRPGGFASATIRAGAVVAPILPESAVMHDAAGAYVYVVGKDGKVVRRAVKTGIVTDEGIAITGGLDASEQVVLRAGGFLSEGDMVKPNLAPGPTKPEGS
ncbi:MAG: efflux RND transporter periplasmic adaptor subunit [Novosphingobium sp.]|nr:efflux RND transporter periplasmic adaptor subunit [Novosphingobium sp.]